MKRRFYYLRTKILLASMSLLYACGPYSTQIGGSDERQTAVVPTQPKAASGTGAGSGPSPDPY